MRPEIMIEAQPLTLALEAAEAALATLSRPRLLAAAARVGATLYRRQRDLPGLLPQGSGASGVRLVAAIMSAEAAANAARLAGDPTYAPARHVKLLTALLAEAAALKQSGGLETKSRAA
ncbi:DUF6477 family protein [Rubrimonas cliftonensis]|uniref:Uncharacterized protein n=1 Tax=Rubrimonas cliftonensis TaxID=89524 RepID=A0A1H3Y9Q1_9RHOB|nr:DUF6477 family protein [Rubrimonas cliftonensis]SEA08270.1 hypothetical protein SAMN05444370_1035 [Rubrimonas cliftonensis]